MAAISTYPTDLTDEANKLVRGDPVAISVTIASGDPVSERFWRSHLRAREDGPLLLEFTIDTVDAVVGGELILRLDAEQSMLIKDGWLFDLEEVTGDDPPVTLRTWWKVTWLGVVKDVSHA